MKAIPEFSDPTHAASFARARLSIDEPDDALGEQLRILNQRLLEANARVNLTAIRDMDQAWHRHALDSLAGLGSGLFDDGARCIDVGAGAGFPGLPLGLARRDLKVTFLEATGKKCAFIQEQIAHFGLDAQVLHARAEAVGHDPAHRDSYDVATARAVGSLAEVAELCLPLLKLGGHAVLWRGSQAHAEAERSQRALHLLGASVAAAWEYELMDGSSAESRRFVLMVLRKTEPTSARFPRRDGLPKSEPLGG